MTLTEKAHVHAPPLHSVLVKKQALAYRQTGTGFPLILLHGWGGSSRYWYSTMASLAATHTSYALDLPGYGQSPAMIKASSVARFAELVIAFADELGLEQFDLNGHSLGGAIASYIAAEYPQRVRRLILTCYGIMPTELEQIIVEAWYANLYPVVETVYPFLGLLQPFEDALKLVAGSTSYNPLVLYTAVRPFFFELPDNPAMLRMGYNEFVYMDQRASLASTLSLGDPCLPRAIRQIRVPTLLIGAHQDAIVTPNRITRTAKLIAGSQLVWIEMCGHAPMIERPAEYERHVGAFLTA